MDLEESLRIIAQRKYHMVEMRLSKYGLVKGQAELLLCIRDNDGSTQNELAKILGIKGSSMSVRLDKLEKIGYICRETDEQNLKKKKIYITQEGKSASVQCRKIIKEYNEIMFKGFSKKDKKQFEEYLNKVIKNVKNNS